MKAIRFPKVIWRRVIAFIVLDILAFIIASAGFSLLDIKVYGIVLAFIALTCADIYPMLLGLFPKVQRSTGLEYLWILMSSAQGGMFYIGFGLYLEINPFELSIYTAILLIFISWGLSVKQRLAKSLLDNTLIA